MVAYLSGTHSVFICSHRVVIIWDSRHVKAVPDPKKRLVWIGMVLAAAGAGVVWWLVQ